MAISKTLRYQVFRRDGFTCQYCGGKPPDVALTAARAYPGLYRLTDGTGP